MLFTEAIPKYLGTDGNHHLKLEVTMYCLKRTVIFRQTWAVSSVDRYK